MTSVGAVCEYLKDTSKCPYVRHLDDRLGEIYSKMSRVPFADTFRPYKDAETQQSRAEMRLAIRTYYSSRAFEKNYLGIFPYNN